MASTDHDEWPEPLVRKSRAVSRMIERPYSTHPPRGFLVGLWDDDIEGKRDGGVGPHVSPQHTLNLHQRPDGFTCEASFPDSM